MSDNKKIYLAKGKVQSPNWMKMSISEKSLKMMMENLSEYSGSRFAKVNINILDQPDKYGKDVEMTLDTWKPDGSQPTAVPPESKEQEYVPIEDSSLPF